jgi:hypothetical protein
MNTINYTESYDVWRQTIEQTTEESLVGETRELYFLDGFKNIKSFLLAPCCMADGKTYVAQVYSFNTIEEIDDLLKNKPSFKLYKCLKSTRNGEVKYLLRGTYR